MRERVRLGVRERTVILDALRNYIKTGSSEDAWQAYRIARSLAKPSPGRRQLWQGKEDDREKMLADVGRWVEELLRPMKEVKPALR